MHFIDKYNCILCKYNKYNKDEDSCFDHLKRMNMVLQLVSVNHYQIYIMEF